METSEIIDLWKSVGWHNVIDYHNVLISEKAEENLRDLLDPDKIDVKKFWKATDIHFGTDTVANSNISGGNSFNVEYANKLNHTIPLWLGLVGSLEFCIFNTKQRFKETNIAEIGSGYGSFQKFFVEKRNDIDNYTGFDIIPRYEKAVEIEDANGSFSVEQVEKFKEKYNIFYSCNVFQHLSLKQILKYTEQVYDMLPEGGYFVFSYVEKNKFEHTYHYGQRVNICDSDTLIKNVENIGFRLWNIHVHLRYDGTLTPIGFCFEKHSLNRTKT